MMVRQHFFRPGMAEGSAISGIEQACWDILGKSLNVPIWQLLGGNVRDEIRLYDHLGGGEKDSVYHALDAEQAREKARESVELGFDAIKLEVVIPRTAPAGRDRVSCATPMRSWGAVREAVGDDVELMVDMHGRSLAADGGAVLPRCSSPTGPGSLRRHVRPTSRGRWPSWPNGTWVPLAAGERLTLAQPFHELLDLGASLRPAAGHSSTAAGSARQRRSRPWPRYTAPSLAPHSSTGPIGHAASSPGRLRHAELHHPGDVARRCPVALRRPLPDA